MVNQMKAKVLELFTLAGRKKILVGNERGGEMFLTLRSEIERFPASLIFEISLKGVEATDASFPRESVISLAKLLRGERGLYVSNFSSQDLIDNWDYAAKAKEQPLVAYDGASYRVLGPELGSRSREIFDFAIRRESVTTADVVAKFGLTPQNASAALKKLLVAGLLLGTKEPAESGGLEYVFQAVGSFR